MSELVIPVSEASTAYVDPEVEGRNEAVRVQISDLEEEREHIRDLIRDAEKDSILVFGAQVLRSVSLFLSLSSRSSYRHRCLRSLTLPVRIGTT